MRALLRMHDVGKPTDPGFEEASNDTRANLVKLIVHYDVNRPTGVDDAASVPRTRLFDLIDVLDRDSPHSAPLVFRALDDKDAAVRARASTAAERILAAAKPRRVTLDALLDAMLAEEITPRTADALFARLDKDSRPILIDLAIARVAFGQKNAHAIVKRFDAADLPLAQLAVQIAGLDTQSQSQLASLVKQVAHDAPDVPRMAAMLTGHDQQIALFTAQIIAAAPHRVTAESVVREALAAGRLIHADVLKALHIDPAAARTWVAPFLKTESPPAQALAAMRLLNFLPGQPDAATTATLATLAASHPEEPVRLDAARLLGDDASLAKARLPNWLKDLRADNPNTRALAARQIQAANLLPQNLTAALVRAVDRRDMPAREGLTLALERAAANDHPDPTLLLKSTAATDPDPTTRAYAKAALRELK